MAIIKSYTTIEQSRKLAEILPLESADMCYPKDAFEYNYAKEPICHYSGIGLAHPCWSLASLLSIIPKHIKDYNVLRIDMDENTFAIWYDEIGYGVNNELPNITKETAIDACYEMIIRLHELKML